jgi:hypothetical protein
MTIRIASLNILAPELLAYFWRSSYALPLIDQSDYFGKFTRTRLEQITNNLRITKADIIALQETSDTVFDSLDGKTTAQFIADKLGYKIASTCMKEHPVRYKVPPFEQEYKDSLIAVTGVCTLFNPETVTHVSHCSCATRVSASNPAAPPSIGSPHIADKFMPISNSSSTLTTDGIIIVNTHLRMSPYPHISDAINELFARLLGGSSSSLSSSSSSSLSLSSSSPLPPPFCSLFPTCPHGNRCDFIHTILSNNEIASRMILVGDFNAGHSVASADLKESINTLQTVYGIQLSEITPFEDIFKEDAELAVHVFEGKYQNLNKECSYGKDCRRQDCAYKHSFGLRLIDQMTNDRIFISKGTVDGTNQSPITISNCHVAHAPQLHLANKTMTRDVKWETPGTIYKISLYNETILKNEEIASDHPLLVFDVKME